MNAEIRDFHLYPSDNEILANYKAEYIRVNGRSPHISRSGTWIIVDYTPVRSTELREMLEALRESPTFVNPAR